MPGLAQRLNGWIHLVVMLAVVHHLSIGASITLSAGAALVASWPSRHLTVEWLDPSDTRVQALCEQRRRDPGELSRATRRSFFEQAGFQL